jgi:hypothetical protein
MRAVRDDGLPVEVARTFSIEHYSLLAFAVMTAASGREALARLAGHVRASVRWVAANESVLSPVTAGKLSG